MDDASVQRGLQKALSESASKNPKAKNDTELAPTDSDASSRSGSPDQCCPICLSKFKDKSFSDGCFHRFCFQCIREWAKVKSTCPLCKTPFKSIIHNVVSSDVYDQYVLQPSENGSFDLDRNGSRFRYHTTLTNNRRSAWETRMDQLFNRQARLAERIHRENEARQRRQLIYAASLRVHHIAANRFTRFRDTSPQFFRENPAVTHRLIPWLRRDLGVLFNGNDQHVRFMTQYILSLLPNVDMQSEEFHNHLRPFLYGRTEHFIHEFTSFARSPHDMDTYDQMAQYDFRPENPQFTSTLRPQHPLVAQESSEESENVHSNNNEVIVISDDETDSNPVVLPLECTRPPSVSRDVPGPSSAPDMAGPSTSFDLASTHNPEPPATGDPNQPGPSGVSPSINLQIKQEHDSAHAKKKVEESEDSSGSVEIVGYQKPFHLRTPIAFITISDDTSGNGKPELSTKGKLSRKKSKNTSRGGTAQEKAGGKRKQKTKHTRSSHSASRAGTWSSDSEDSYYRSRHDRHYPNSREGDDERDSSHTSRFYSRNRSTYHHRSSHSPNELFRKVREERSKWSLYYETRHGSRGISSPRSQNQKSRSRSRSRSRSPPKSYPRRFFDDYRYNDYVRAQDHSRESSKQSRDDRHRWRSRSRSPEHSRERPRQSIDERYKRSRSRSRGRSFEPFSDESKWSSRYSSNRYGSTSSTISRYSLQDNTQKSSKKEGASPSHVSTAKSSKLSSQKRNKDNDDEQPKTEGDSHHSKKHKRKHKHHKKKNSKHRHKSKGKDKETSSKSTEKSSNHQSQEKEKKCEEQQTNKTVESVSDSTADGETVDKNKSTQLCNLETLPGANAEPHVTLQDLLNMDEDVPEDSQQPRERVDKDSVSHI